MAWCWRPSKSRLPAPPETAAEAPVPGGRWTCTVKAPPLIVIGTTPDGVPSVMSSRLAPVLMSREPTGRHPAEVEGLGGCPLVRGDFPLDVRAQLQVEREAAALERKPAAALRDLQASVGTIEAHFRLRAGVGDVRLIEVAAVHDGLGRADRDVRRARAYLDRGMVQAPDRSRG